MRKYFDPAWRISGHDLSLLSLQLVIMAVAGCSQFYYLAIMHRMSTPAHFGLIALILGIPSILQFIDFGTTYTCFRAFISFRSTNSTQSKEEVRYSFLMALKISILGMLMTVIAYELLGLSKPLTTALLLLFVSLLSSWWITAFRGLQKFATYIVIFNSSWPLSLLILMLMQRSDSKLTFSNIYYFLPTLATIATGLIALPLVLRASKIRLRNLFPNRFYTSRSTRSKQILLMFRANQVQLGNVLSIQSDKYLIAWISGLKLAGLYAVVSTLVIGISSIISLTFQRLLAKRLRQQSSFGDEKRNLAFIGFVSVFLIYFASYYVIPLFYTGMTVSFTLICCFLPYPVAQSYMYFYQLKFFSDEDLVIRMRATWVQFASSSLFLIGITTMFPFAYVPLALSVGACMSTLYLKKMFVLRGDSQNLLA